MIADDIISANPHARFEPTTAHGRAAMIAETAEQKMLVLWEGDHAVWINAPWDDKGVEAAINSLKMAQPGAFETRMNELRKIAGLPPRWVQADDGTWTDLEEAA